MEILIVILDFIRLFVDLILHLDQTLAGWSQWMGPWLYLVVFLIVFAETGLVVTPFLPGDSLLFALGALAAIPESHLRVDLLAVTLMSAALIGDNVNYFVGRKIGLKLFHNPDSKFLNPKHLQKTEVFYQKHGPKAIVIGRFIPIVRTFVPFVAGVGKMSYRRYLLFSFIGALLWIPPFLLAGSFFGNLPAVKQNFHIVIFAVIAISVLPVAIEVLRARLAKSSASTPGQ